MNIFSKFKEQIKEQTKEDQERKRMLDAFIREVKEKQMPDSMSAAQIGEALANAAHMIDRSAGVQHVAGVGFPHVTPPGNLGAAASPPNNQWAQGQVLGNQGWVNPPTVKQSGSANNKAEHMFSMLAMRMRWDTNRMAAYGYDIPFHGITLLERTDGTVLILVATATDHVLLEDDGQMFPSDNLITKLRVLTP